MIARDTVRILAALLPVALGCATSKGAGAPSPQAAAPRAAAPAREGPAPSGPAPSGPARNGKAVAPEAPQVSARAQRLFEEAVAAEGEQRKLKVPTDWEVLERKWRAVVAAEELPEAWFNVGVCLERQGKGAEARRAWERAQQLRPTFREAAVDMAVLSEPEDPRAAVSAYAQLLRRFPEDAVVRVRLASLYQASGQPDEAWRLAREALARDPKVPGAQKVMMKVALERGNLDLAELLAVRSQKLDPGDAEIPFFLGEVAARRGDEAGAAVLYRKALAQRDDLLPARVALFRIALRNRSWEKVVEQGKAILQRDPANARVQLAVGVAHRYLGQADQAAAAYAQAESLSGDRLPEVHLARGLLEMKVRSRWEPALAELRRYADQAGPALRGDDQVFRLIRECEQMLVATKQAEEAARQAQRESARQAAEEAAKKAAEGPKPAEKPKEPR